MGVSPLLAQKKKKITHTITERKMEKENIMHALKYK
jgi:hypothetical protein